MNQNTEIASDSEEETITCPSCVSQNPKTANFCSKCDAPLSAISVLGPFEQIRAQKFIFHRAATGPSSLLTVIGMWIIFIPFILQSLFTIYAILAVAQAYHKFSIYALLYSLFSFALAGIGICLLWRVTKNYKNRIRKEIGNENGA